MAPDFLVALALWGAATGLALSAVGVVLRT
jgi:hypothetical protein